MKVFRRALLALSFAGIAAAAIRLLGMTLRFEDVCDPGVTPGYLIPPPGVFAFWHRSLLMAAYRFRGMGIAILISQSFDGELIARTVERLGFLAVRGSSSRGGAAGLIAMERACRGDVSTGPRLAAFTADGPRGPIYIAKPGVTLLSQRVNGDAGAFHLEPAKAWTLKSWDRFFIPKPFTRVAIGWPAHVDLQHSTLSFEAQHAQVQAALDRAVVLAEECIR